jgi:glutamate synthase (NADPH/NADH)
MTGGVVVILGATGRNFGAGMSGGISYVLDADGQFKNRCNLAMVDLEPVVEKDDVHILKDLIQRHEQLTGSALAKRILANWEIMLPRFVKVFPKEYRRALGEMAAKQSGRAIESKKVETWS